MVLKIYVAICLCSASVMQKWHTMFEFAKSISILIVRLCVFRNAFFPISIQTEFRAQFIYLFECFKREKSVQPFNLDFVCKRAPRQNTMHHFVPFFSLLWQLQIESSFNAIRFPKIPTNSASSMFEFSKKQNPQPFRETYTQNILPSFHLNLIVFVFAVIIIMQLLTICLFFECFPRFTVSNVYNNNETHIHIRLCVVPECEFLLGVRFIQKTHTAFFIAEHFSWHHKSVEKMRLNPMSNRKKLGQ